MKLISIHKQIKLALLLLIGVSSTSSIAQDVWTLQQCLDTAIVNNAKLKIDKNNNELASQKEKEVKSNLIPKVTANADYKYYMELPTQLMPLSVFGGPAEQYKSTQFGVPHNINANIQFAMPLYNPELYGGIKKTKIATEVSELQYQKSKEQILYEISFYYYNAQIVNSQLKFIDDNLVNSRQLLKNVNLLHEQLLLTKTDVDKVALQVQSLETNRLIVAGKYDQILNGLKLLLGVSSNQIFTVEPEIKQQIESNYTIQPTLDMQMAQKQYELLKTDLGTLQKSRYLPSVYLYGSYGTLGYGFKGDNNEFLDFYNMGFVGLKASYSIFNGTVTQKKINQVNIQIDNNVLQQGLIKDQNEVQIENANLQINVAQNTIKSSELQIKLAQSIYNQVILQQKEGLASLTEVLLADSGVKEAQQNYLSAIIEYFKADLELKKLTGNIK
ncbi:MAG TPA: TolC family protein [Crocinitomix sp.]|nr:TolC family protein [Crocinitomix sp.]